MTLETVAVVIMVGAAIAGQYFAARAAECQAHADWHRWLADGWRMYGETGDIFAAFGTHRPDPSDHILKPDHR